MKGISLFIPNVTEDEILHRDLVPDNPLPRHSLPLVWFVGNVLSSLWTRRKNGRPCHLYEIRTDIDAQISLLRRTIYNDICITVDSKISV